MGKVGKLKATMKIEGIGDISTMLIPLYDMIGEGYLAMYYSIGRRCGNNRVPKGEIASVMDSIIIWTHKLIQKLQNVIFFKIFKIPFNGQLV